MVTLRFRLSEVDEVKVNLREPQQLHQVLQKGAAQAGIELGGVIAIRNGKVITPATFIDCDDCIEVFPAISGG